MVVSFELLRVVVPREEVVLLPSVVMPRSLLVVLLSSLELPDSSVDSELVVVPFPKKVLASS
jgi:hypothetical protein